jgi:hypothetical protein
MTAAFMNAPPYAPAPDFYSRYRFNWRAFVASFLSNPSVRQTAIANYHVRGVYSMMLHSTPDLRIRWMVVMAGEHDLWKSKDLDSPDLVLAPHNHSFDFHSVVTSGMMLNLRLRLLARPRNGDGEDVWRMYRYQSGVKTEEHNHQLTPLGKTHAEVYKSECLCAGDSYFMQSDEFHVISVDRFQSASILLLEGPQTKDHTLMIHRKELPATWHLGTEFYRPISDAEFQKVIGVGLGHVEGTDAGKERVE